MTPENKKILKNWWLLFIKGILISTYGILYFINYSRQGDKFFNFKVLLPVFIIILILNGVLILFGSFFHKKNNVHWLYWLIEGIFELILGIAVYIAFKDTLLFMNAVFIQFIAFWAFILGIIHTLSANKVKKYVPYARFALFSGIGVIVLSLTIIVLAVIVFFIPNLVVLPKFYFIGSFCFIIGILLSLISIILRKIYSD